MCRIPYTTPGREIHASFTKPKPDERLSVDDPKGISADFAAICRRVSEHPILVLPSVFPIDE